MQDRPHHHTHHHAHQEAAMPTLPHPHTRTACALAIGLLCATAASAQSFTATLLNRPSGATYCHESLLEPLLGDNGDVIATCNSPKVSLAGFFGAILGGGGGVAETSSKATVWRAGSATPRTLAGTLAGTVTQTNTTPVGILADGTVLGYAFNNNGQTLSAWKTTTRANYALPSGYGGWVLDQVAPAGKVILLRQNDLSAFGMGIATVTAGVAKRLPSPPSACGKVGSSGNSFDWVVNDLGQVAVLRMRKVSGNYSTSNIGTVCLWNGSAWVVSADAPSFVDPVYFDTDFYGMTLQGLNNQGQVLLRQVNPLQWQAGVGFQQLDKAIDTYGAGSDLLGSDGSSAKLWRNGQPIDLNQASTVPAGYTLVRAIGSNARGQVLVITQPVAAASSSLPEPRLVLLTPR
jgi:hypothetical protein